MTALDRRANCFPRSNTGMVAIRPRAGYHWALHLPGTGKENPNWQTEDS